MVFRELLLKICLMRQSQSVHVRIHAWLWLEDRWRAAVMEVFGAVVVSEVFTPSATSARQERGTQRWCRDQVTAVLQITVSQKYSSMQKFGRLQISVTVMNIA